MKRVRVVSALVALVALGMVGFSMSVAYRSGHQRMLDRQLIEAIKHMDTNAALAALNAGANPNAHNLAPNHRTLIEHVRDLIFLRHSIKRMNSNVYGHGRWNEQALDLVFEVPLSQHEDYLHDRNRYRQVCTFVETVCHALLEHGANPNPILPTDSNILYDACYMGDEPCVRDLVSHGANVNGVIGEGQSLLRVDIFKSRISEFLLAKGTDPNYANVAGETPLWTANTADEIRLLVRYGANFHVSDLKGYTPLLWHVEHRNPDVVAAWLKCGADPYHCDKSGENAFVINNNMLTAWKPVYNGKTEEYRLTLRIHDILEQYRRTHPEKQKSEK